VLPDAHDNPLVDSHIGLHLAGGVDYGTASYQGIEHNTFYPLQLR
jgi:hypothetical protein